MCVIFLHYISDEMIKTTRDTVQHSSFKFCNAEQCGQSNIPVLRLLLLNMKCHYYISFIKDCILLLN